MLEAHLKGRHTNSNLRIDLDLPSELMELFLHQDNMRYLLLLGQLGSAVGLQSILFLDSHIHSDRLMIPNKILNPE